MAHKGSTRSYRDLMAGGQKKNDRKKQPIRRERIRENARIRTNDFGEKSVAGPTTINISILIFLEGNKYQIRVCAQVATSIV